MALTEDPNFKVNPFMHCRQNSKILDDLNLLELSQSFLFRRVVTLADIRTECHSNVVGSLRTEKAEVQINKY
jgi:hypothetical protein